MNFKQFAINITNHDIPDINDKMISTTIKPIRRRTLDGFEVIPPESIMKSIDITTNMVRPYLNRMDKVQIPYIEKRFENLERVFNILDMYDCNGIPDWILNTFSNSVYGKSFNKLSNDERSIIAVLSAYILI